jgi:hypothetical protein
MVMSYLLTHSTLRVNALRAKHNVSESLMAAALIDLERDGYKRAANVVRLISNLQPGATLELDQTAQKALSIAHGCTYDTQRLIGPLLRHRYVTRA